MFMICCSFTLLVIFVIISFPTQERGHWTYGLLPVFLSLPSSLSVFLSRSLNTVSITEVC